MLFEAFTGGFLGNPGMRGRIDTRLLRGNVFYREKTFLRQLFFQGSAVRPYGCAEEKALGLRVSRKAILLLWVMR
jgi:hypothetical protein